MSLEVFCGLQPLVAGHLPFVLEVAGSRVANAGAAQSASVRRMLEGCMIVGRIAKSVGSRNE